MPHLFLHQIPFAALPLKDGYLGDRFRLRYAPSLQVLGFCQGRQGCRLGSMGPWKMPPMICPLVPLRGRRWRTCLRLSRNGG